MKISGCRIASKQQQCWESWTNDIKLNQSLKMTEDAFRDASTITVVT